LLNKLNPNSYKLEIMFDYQKGKKDKGKPDSEITRKTFLKQSTFSLLGLSILPSLSINHQDKQRDVISDNKNSNDYSILRTIEYNVFNGAIGYKGINSSKLPPGDNSMLIKEARHMEQIPRRIKLQLALYKPNIISFCEAPIEDIVAEIAGKLNMSYAYFPSVKNGYRKYPQNSRYSWPGGILTRYEIVNSENRPFVNKKNNNPKKLFTRHWGKVELRLPNGDLITVHSAHLWPYGKKGRKIRLKEIGELLKSIHFDLNHNSKSVILQGDLNHSPGTPGYDKLKNGGLTDMFKKVGKGNGYTHNSIKPAKRIDYIYAIGAISEQMKKCRPLFEGDFRINTEDPKSFALSDHIPLLGDFEM
jgi:endonuclease/exonuclease/phosphatase family metal-dependent hydrolase